MEGISLLSPCDQVPMAQAPTLPRPGLPSWLRVALQEACRDSRAGRQGCGEEAPPWPQNPETYQACKLDPGVDRLRPGVPASTSLTTQACWVLGGGAFLLGSGCSGQAGVRGKNRRLV